VKQEPQRVTAGIPVLQAGEKSNEADIGLTPNHDLRHTFGYRLSETSGHNRAELERRLGHAYDRYLWLYTNPPDDIAAGYVEDL
jgi:integrase